MRETPHHQELSGHCLCGYIQFSIEEEPNWVAYCHCDSCKRATGGVIAAYAGFAKDRVKFHEQSPQYFASSPGVKRGFCPKCGSPISYESTRWPDEIHLFLGIIDQVAQLQPQSHVYTKEQLAWLHIDDALPHYITVPNETKPG